MFCSDDCHTKSFQRYHQYECPIIDQLIRSGSVHMALRLFFVALSTFDGSVENLEAFLKENNDQKSTIFDFDFKTIGNLKDSKTFPLHSHEEILKNHPTLNKSWKKHEKFVKSFLLRLCQISDLNFHGIFSGNSQITFNENPTSVLCNMQQSIGSGSMLFASMFNHSCANNVLRICVEGKITYVVCRPIEQGSQLFDCYK
jgi:SET and MYND domain-containing protein 4